MNTHATIQLFDFKNISLIFYRLQVINILNFKNLLKNYVKTKNSEFLNEKNRENKLSNGFFVQTFDFFSQIEILINYVSRFFS